jgi:hypothetical protein
MKSIYQFVIVLSIAIVLFVIFKTFNLGNNYLKEVPMENDFGTYFQRTK